MISSPELAPYKGMWEGGGGELGGRPELSMVLFLLLRVHQKVNNKIDEHL